MYTPNRSNLSHNLNQLSVQEPLSPEELNVSTLDEDDSWTQEMYEQKLSNFGNSIDPLVQKRAPNYEEFCSCIGSVSPIAPRHPELRNWRQFLEVLSKHTVHFWVDFKFKRTVERNDFHRSMRNLSTWFRNKSKEYCDSDLDNDYWHLFLEAIQSYELLCGADAFELSMYPDQLTETEQTAAVTPFVYAEEIPQIASIVTDTPAPSREHHYGTSRIQTEVTDTPALSGEHNYPIIQTTRQQRPRRLYFKTIICTHYPGDWPSIESIQAYLRPCCQNPENKYIMRDNDKGKINGRLFRKYSCKCSSFAPNESDGAWIRILRQAENPDMYEIQINTHDDNKCHHWNSDGTRGSKVELLPQRVLASSTTTSSDTANADTGDEILDETLVQVL